MKRLLKKRILASVLIACTAFSNSGSLISDARVSIATIDCYGSGFIPPSSYWSIKEDNIALGKGEKTKISITPTVADVKYRSENQAVATVDSNGKIVAKGKGTTYIFVTANNITKQVKVTVKAAPTKVSAKKKTIKLKKGKKATIKYSLSKGACGKVTFSSSNKKVVSVSSAGKITAKKKGTVKVKIKTYNGKTAVVKVVVK